MTHFIICGSNEFVALKTMNFENFFNKKYSFLYDENHGCIIYVMYDQGVIIFYKQSSTKL